MSHHKKKAYINPARTGWDAQIMDRRAELELYFLLNLTAAQQSAWTAQMNSDPPYDAQGHRFITGFSPSPGQVEVTPQTQFAWQWCTGSFHFGMQPTAAPTADADPTVTITAYSNTSSQIVIGIDSSSSVAIIPGIIVYGTNPNQSGYANPVSAARCLGKWQPDSLPRNLDITACYAETYGQWASAPIFVAAWGVNTRGGLQPLTSYSLLTP
jgi:hypothetical protein